MLRVMVFCGALLLSTAAAWADEDCDQSKDLDRAISGCTRLIQQNPRNARAYNNRGLAHGRKGDLDRAIADFNKAIENDPKYAHAYASRGLAHGRKGDLDRAIADFNKAIDIDPINANAYATRGIAYNAKGDLNRAIADFNKAINIDPKNANAYNGRGWFYYKKGDYDRAIADASVSLTLDPKNAIALGARGRAYLANRNYDRALADFGLAITIDPTRGAYFEGRGETYEAKGDREKAIEDYNIALALAAPDADAKDFQAEATRRLAAHKSAPATTTSVATAAPLTISPKETRLALVITNAAYPSEVGALANPHRDGEVIASALQSVGFEKGNIAIIKDADQPALRLAVADFVERIEKAGPDAVAFLYYSGHGAADRTERGENYLIPVGAKIALAKQLPVLGVSLTEITKSLERVAAKARFVVIDACRNVAFTKGLKDAAKGLIPERKLDGMIVAFATRPGETAEDNSIYAKALASILPTPGLEAEQVFKETQRKVADMSKGTQIPWTEDGLLTRFKFKEAAPRAGQSPATVQPQPQFEVTREWYRVDKESVAELETFVRRHGSSPEADYARARIEGLKKQQVAVAMPPAQQSSAKQSARLAANIMPTSPAARCNGVETQIGDERKCLKPKDSFKDCPSCPEMVVVPSGSFTMGSAVNEPQRGFGEDQIGVSIAAPFAVGKFAVTFNEWDACVAGGGCIGHKPDDKGWGRGKRPVINVSWSDVKLYVAWLNAKTGKGYRLPSEAEREYVTRAGTTTPFWWGSSITSKQANYDGNYTYDGGGSKGEYRRRPMPVDTFEPSPWGLYNVHGNVWEWTEDCWTESNSGNPGNGSARTAGDCDRRVVRGGSWLDIPRSLRAANRFGGSTVIRHDFGFGFRLARTLLPASAAPEPTLSAADITEIRSILRSCVQSKWSLSGNILGGGESAVQTEVKLRLRLNPDGTLAAPPQVTNTQNTASFLAASDSATRALQECAPFPLPAAKYDLWKDMIMTFVPSGTP